MAGLEGIEQPRRHVSATAARWSPAIEDERALKALELFGNPTEAEVPLPSRPESAATARRITSCVMLRQWALPPQTAEHGVLLVSELVGNAVRHARPLPDGTIQVSWKAVPHGIQLSVTDGGSSTRPHRVNASSSALAGRGMAIVDSLAYRWWIDQTHSRCTVNAVLPTA
jgi:anti-sigma regulatory factor (Ser/Thr protein kinase)